MAKKLKQPGQVRKTTDGRYVVDGKDGKLIKEIVDYIQSLQAAGKSTATQRAYSYALLAWYRWCWSNKVAWDKATNENIASYVNWLQHAENPQRERTLTGRPQPGTVNEKTGKAYLDPGYSSATINHRLTIIDSFYNYHLRQKTITTGPKSTPVKTTTEETVAKKQKLQVAARSEFGQKDERENVELSTRLYNRFFLELRSNRDRAVVTLLAYHDRRPEEVLGMRRSDIDIENKLVRFGQEEEWQETTKEFWVFLDRYYKEIKEEANTYTLWQTLRGAPRPLTYWALRQVIERINQKLGTNLEVGDLRGAHRSHHIKPIEKRLD
jgi:integrase